MSVSHGNRVASSGEGVWGRRVTFGFLAAIFLFLLGHGPSARAEVRFDVFVGYDRLLREASWFPVVCEVYNDGPTFNAVFEFSMGNIGQGQTHHVPVELPTNTEKRLVIPVFASGSRFGGWSARLVDQQGNVQAEQLNVRSITMVDRNAHLMGSLSREFSGASEFPETKVRADVQPRTARLQPDLFPDNPIALEGLDTLYLNTERALELNVKQTEALLAWLHAGGHLVLAIEQALDVNSTPWLGSLVGREITGNAGVKIRGPISDWLRSSLNSERGYGPLGTDRRTQENPYSDLAGDPEFGEGEQLVATADFSEETVALAAGSIPLIVEERRGRGWLTLLTFSPEREPFVSWKHRPWAWARLARIPPSVLSGTDQAFYNRWSIDGVFGAMIDSKQVRKLPVEWLLLLLVVYLLVIGPLDQYWLKKINRQMLTWLTFPAYVILFSVLIYFIGYKLRAGEIEWNELHLVDILPRGEQAELRGRTYASVYSPANSRYRLAGTQKFATLRGEYQGVMAGGQDSGSTDVIHRGDGYQAEIFVPVWISQLYVHDWWQSAVSPMSAKVQADGSGLHVQVRNRLPRDLTEVRLAWQGNIYDLGELPAEEEVNVHLNPGDAEPLDSFVRTYAGGRFEQAVRSRQRAFGDTQRAHLDNLPICATVASFVSLRDSDERRQGGFVTPPGIDLGDLVKRGDAVLLAWDEGNSLTEPINRFDPRRGERNTLLRLAVPVHPDATSETN